MKKCIASFITVFALLFLFFSKPIYSQSNYVLPYPSFMPGSTAYKIHLVWEKLTGYWYFGNFSQFSHNLKQSDKYLVESKTLFEYKQYLFAYNSLEKSNSYFEKANIYLNRAKKEGKNIAQKKILYKEAALKHIEIINKIKTDSPDKFIWEPEKDKPTILNIDELLNSSKRVREIAL